jgi:hypothetical protein
MITANDLVKREVFYCVSHLVSTIAQGYGGLNEELGDLAEQAFELASPLEDWEEAATDSGWRLQDGEWIHDDEVETFSSPQDACEHRHVDPYQRDVFEHWIVSDWLADKLAEKGEKVDKDFAGLTVWARTTTGQGIASDWVIEQIVADLNKSESTDA